MLRSVSARLARSSVRSTYSVPALSQASSRVAAASFAKASFSASSFRSLSTSSPRSDAIDDALAQLPPVHANPEAQQDEPFSQLKGKISDATLSALTGKPFNFVNMSTVQTRVLKLLPGLVGDGDVRGAEDGKRDLLVKARTGTGKTVAFLTPAIESRLKTLAAQPDVQGFRYGHAGALIVTPTRELAIQIAAEAKALTSTQPNKFGVHLFVGGESKGLQLKEWGRNGKDIIVGTPGRLLDMLQSQPSVAMACRSIETLILDEADTMLDMGFDRDLQAILRTLPPSRQTFLFSATVSPAIQNIATTFLKPNSLFLDVVPKGEAQTVDRIDQHATVLPSANQMLPHILRVVAHDQLIRPKSKIILFCNTTKMTQLMATIVRNMTSYLPAGQNTRVYEIHSKMEQRDRSRTSDRFRQEKSESSILVTSDVSARGVDYPGTSRVIQFGISGDGEQYTHRVGRTGRGGAEGRGDIVLCPFEAGFLDTELRKFPIKSLSVNELRSEVADLAGKRGQDVAEKLNQLEQGVAEIQSRLSPDVLGEVFGSMLGYYAKMDKVLAIRKDDIPGGIIQLGAQGFGMNPPPSFSQGFLAKVGFGGSGGGGSRSRGFAGYGGSRGGGGGSYGRGGGGARASGGSRW